MLFADLPAILGHGLLPPKYASAREMQLLRKTMNVTMTSNIGIWDSIFQLHYVDQVACLDMR